MEALLQHLDNFYTTMSLHGVDPDLIRQVVKQLYHIICSVSFNHLLLRKDMCSWSTGLQIRCGLWCQRTGVTRGRANRRALPGSRYNSWQLQDWLMDRELADCGAKETLESLKQAALLLQVNKKTEADAAAIGGLCTAISPTQVGRRRFGQPGPNVSAASLNALVLPTDRENSEPVHAGVGIRRASVSCFHRSCKSKTAATFK